MILTTDRASTYLSFPIEPPAATSPKTVDAGDT